MQNVQKLNQKSKQRLCMYYYLIIFSLIQLNRSYSILPLQIVHALRKQALSKHLHSHTRLKYNYFSFWSQVQQCDWLVLFFFVSFLALKRPLTIINTPGTGSHHTPKQNSFTDKGKHDGRFFQRPKKSWIIICTVKQLKIIAKDRASTDIYFHSDYVCVQFHLIHLGVVSRPWLATKPHPEAHSLPMGQGRKQI